MSDTTCCSLPLWRSQFPPLILSCRCAFWTLKISQPPTLCSSPCSCSSAPPTLSTPFTSPALPRCHPPPRSSTLVLPPSLVPPLEPRPAPTLSLPASQVPPQFAAFLLPLPALFPLDLLSVSPPKFNRIILPSLSVSRATFFNSHSPVPMWIPTSHHLLSDSRYNQALLVSSPAPLRSSVRHTHVRQWHPTSRAVTGAPNELHHQGNCYQERSFTTDHASQGHAACLVLALGLFHLRLQVFLHLFSLSLQFSHFPFPLRFLVAEVLEIAGSIGKP